MNVAFDPWIPVVTLDGKPKLASLYEVLAEGHLLADLAVRPHERVALMRLFLCVAHAALDGPKDYDEWCEVPKRLPDAARKYLETWKDSFELFHPTKPWLQVPDLSPAKENDEKAFASTSKLDFALASGSNTALFDHEGSNDRRAIDSPKLAMGLLVTQNFSTCGLLGRPIWAGKPTADSAADAPCISSSMYHALLIGENLLETIGLNVCDVEELSMLWGGFWKQSVFGRPAWESMPESASASGSQLSYLGRLVPISRAIKLYPGGVKMLYGEALRYPAFPDFPREFTAAEGVSKSKAKEVRYLVGAKLNIRPWRQLDAILVYSKTKDRISCALPLKHYSGERVDVWVGALVRNPGKQDILDSQESRFGLFKELCSEEGGKAYSACVEISSDVERRLLGAISKYREILDPTGESGLGAAAINQYWTAVESRIGMLFDHIREIGTELAAPTRDAWDRMLWQTARDAYASVCGQETPRQIKAFTEGWKKLHYKPKEQDETPKKKGAKK